jgi:hypothetical protein
MMKQPHTFYSYQYLFKISSTSPVFIKKMIALFLNSLAEYISDLEKQTTGQQLTDLQKIIHKLKPSVLSLEVKGAKEELLIIDAATTWNQQVQESVERLLQTFKMIQPLMQQDLEEMKDE